MLDLTPDNLRREIESAIEYRALITNPSAERKNEYVGSYFQDGRQPEIESHENHSFDYVVNTVPSLAYANPKTTVKSRRPRVHRELTQHIRAGLNRWVSDVDFVERAIEFAYDMQFDFAVALVTMEEIPGTAPDGGGALRPAIRRISPESFFQDPQARSSVRPRFQGHEDLVDIDDLENATEIDPVTGEERYVYDREAIAMLNIASMDRQRGFSTDRGVGAYRSVERNQARIWEVYVAETGMIYTLAALESSNEAIFLREPREFFGDPKIGPYVLGGIYHVPECFYPLAPLAITAGLVDELNAHIDQTSEQADNARQFTIVNSDNNELINQVKQAQDGDILGMPGFTSDQAQTVNHGGPNPEQMAYITALRERLDRKSGLTDFQRGNVTGDATATENELAASASDTRRRFMQNRFRAFVKRILGAVKWLMVSSNNIVFAVEIEKDQFENGRLADISFRPPELEDGVFFGGPQDDDPDFDPDDLEVDIELLSMEYEDSATQQRRYDELFAHIMAVAQAAPTMPWVNWPRLSDIFGESRNIPDIRSLINWRMIEEVIGAKFAGSPEDSAPGTEGTPAPDPKAFMPGSAVRKFSLIPTGSSADGSSTSMEREGPIEASAMNGSTTN